MNRLAVNLEHLHAPDEALRVCEEALSKADVKTGIVRAADRLSLEKR